MFRAKRRLLQSPLGRALRETRAYAQVCAVRTRSRVLRRRHVLCVSPYKTGTTFLAECYDSSYATHEPLQYMTLRYVHGCSHDLFTQRLNYIGLPLECSGHLSRIVDQFVERAPPGIRCVCVGRTPSEWVTSVVNYWKVFYDEGFQQADYLDTLFWQPALGESLYSFFEGGDRAREKLLMRLERFYLWFTQTALRIPDVIFIPLTELRERLAEIDDLVGARGNADHAWRRENSSRFYVHRNDECDRRYADLVGSAGHGRGGKFGFPAVG